MTNKNNRYASFLLPTIFYKFHASKHIMILSYFKNKKIFKNLDQHWFNTMLYSSYIYHIYYNVKLIKYILESMYDWALFLATMIYSQLCNNVFVWCTYLSKSVFVYGGQLSHSPVATKIRASVHNTQRVNSKCLSWLLKEEHIMHKRKPLNRQWNYTNKWFVFENESSL